MMPLHTVFYFTDDDLDHDREAYQLNALLGATERHVAALVTNSEHYDWWWELFDEACRIDDDEADNFERSFLDAGLDPICRN
jgi:hypothetical protein